MLIAFQSDTEYNNLITKMTERFGDISTTETQQLSFLGLTITSIEDAITIDQKGYLEKLLSSIKDFDYQKAKYPCKSDFTINDLRFLDSRAQSDPLMSKIMKSLTMKIMFAATRTRRDVLFLTSFLASINCPTQNDIDATKQVIAYLYNTRDKQQIFYRNRDIELIMFSDASFRAFADGTGQNCQIVYPDKHSAAIYFSSKRQHKITLSAAESETTALVDLTKVGELMHNRLTEVKEETPVPLAYCDNMATVNQTRERYVNTSGNSKYYIHHIHFLNQKVKDNKVNTVWKGTLEMDADLGTKPLGGAKFLAMADKQFKR